MKQTIPITMPDGSIEKIDADTVVNAENALLESMRRPPLFHRIQMIPCRVDVEREVAQIQGGIGFIKHPARMRMAAAAGCRQYGAPRVWRELVGDKWVTRAQVSFTRPGFYDQPVSIIAEGVEDEQPAKIRQHFTAKLQTQATKRCLTQILGESFNYEMAYLRSRNGLFVFANISEDPEDERVQQIVLERMRNGGQQLYGTAPQAALPAAAETVAIPANVDPEFGEFEGEAVDNTTPSKTESAVSSEGTASPVKPAWAKSYAADRLSGDINWESLPLEQTEKHVRAELKSSDYDMDADKYGIVKACKAADWIDAARRLYAYQTMQGGGADA